MKPTLTLLAFAVVLSNFGFESPAVAQRNVTDWPHLTPHGFGLHIASGNLQHAPWDYKPRKVTGAKSFLQVPFLPVIRRGERVDVFVPETAGEDDRLPCIVLYYGGGWGGKYTGGLREITRDLVARGYVVAFLDRHVKHPRQAAAPEAYPAGGPIYAPTNVALQKIYSDGAIHFTTDGTEPKKQSPVYCEPLTISPGQSLRAIVIKSGLEPSGVASFTFPKATSPRPIIVNARQHYTGHVGKRLEAKLSADGDGIVWGLVGRRGHVIDRKAHSRESHPWLSIDTSSGVLSGTPSAPGYNVVVVVARQGTGAEALVDARQVLVVVQEQISLQK